MHLEIGIESLTEIDDKGEQIKHFSTEAGGQGRRPMVVERCC